MTTPSTQLSTESAWVGPADRIDSLDYLRGIALLGIFLINSISMGWPMVSLANPTAYGDFSGLNWLSWLTVHVFAQQKFITIFSMLFGAGVLLFCQRLQARGGVPGKLHRRRMGWLALLGLAHAWLLWYGDILFTYAVAGLLAYLWRNSSALKQLVWGICLYLLPVLFMLLVQLTIGLMDEEALSAMRVYWQPTAEELQAEIGALQGNFAERLQHRAPLILSMQTDSLLFGSLWLALGGMLIGMALFNYGVMSAKASGSALGRLALLAPLGWAFTVVGVVSNLRYDFALEYSMLAGQVWNYVGAMLSAIGYVAIFIWLFKRCTAKSVTGSVSVTGRLQAVGRMAFTLYIMQTLIGVALFKWFGLFGEFERYQFILLSFAVWALQLWLAPWYLARYKQGPLEAIWRRLTYAGINKVSVS